MLSSEIREKSLEIIALQQPVSTDLRRVITVLKATSDLERMGDHAVSVAKAAIRMKEKFASQLLKKKSRKWDVKFVN